MRQNEDFWGNIRKGLEESLLASAECAEFLAQQGRARLDVAAIKKQIQQLHGEVGKMVHGQNPEGESAEITAEMRKALERLSELKKELRDKEAIVEELRTESRSKE